MLIDDDTVRQWSAEESCEGRIHVVDLFPSDVPKSDFNAAFTETVVTLADDDPRIKLLAQTLSDEVEGVGYISALKVLASCGMMMNAIEEKRGNG